MTASQIQTFKIIEPSEHELPSVIAASIGNPTDENIKTVLESYLTERHNLIGCFDDEKLVGVLGFELASSNATIKHISVLPAYRSQNIGMQLVVQLIKQFSPSSLSAETDGDSVGFYRSLKFECVAFEGPFGTRYRCELSVS